MFNQTKYKAVIALILLASILTTINPYVVNVKAQNQATVNISASMGSLYPTPGTYNYTDGTDVTFTAASTDATLFVFSNWVISTDAGTDYPTDNPLTLTVTGGVTYNISAIFFQPLTEPIVPNTLDTSADATVVVLHAVGGHTDPPEGKYYLVSAADLKLTAIPDSGWKFDHWVISGNTSMGHGGSPFTLTPTDNPYTVGHGHGYTYAYQPVFVPISSSPSPSPTAPPTTTGGLSTETIIIIAVVVIIILVAVIGAYYYSRRRHK